MNSDDGIYEIENVIPVEYQKHIEELMLGFPTHFSWVLNSSLVAPDSMFKDRSDNPAGFMHFLFEDEQIQSPYFNLIYPLVLSIPSKAPIAFNKLVRMRAVLTLPNTNSDLEYHLPHIDQLLPHYNAIYYVNDSDGDTFIFNETSESHSSTKDAIKEKISTTEFTVKKRVTPKRGKILLFPGKYYHSSSFAKRSKARCLININLEKLSDIIKHE